MRLLVSIWLCAVGFVIAGGCGKSGGVLEVKVTGSVTQGTKAQDGVLVNFIPADRKQETSKGSRTDADGKFEVMVQPGKYTVVLTRWVDKKGKVPKDSENPLEDYAQLEASGYLKQVLPAKYGDPASSPFKVDIPAEGKELPAFDVK
jgi:hypothetical protein